MGKPLKRRKLSATDRHIREAMAYDVPYEEFSFGDTLKFFDNKCAYTGQKFGKKNKASRDHIVPISRGGGYLRNNILPCTREANSIKGDADFWEWYKTSKWYDEKRLKKIVQWLVITGGSIPNEFKQYSEIN